MPALKGVCHKRSWFLRGLCHLHLVLVVVEKSHSFNTCLVSYSWASLCLEASHIPAGNGRHRFSQHCSYHPWQWSICFLRLTLGVNFLNLVRAASFVLSCGMLPASLIKPKQDLLVWADTEINIISYLPMTRQWILWISYIWKKKFLQSSHFLQLSYWHLWKEQVTN